MTSKPRHSPEGEALFQVIVLVLGTFFKLRAADQRMGTVSSWGGGNWGLMRSLALEGPQTVPQLARARPVARQRIQKIADELAAAGLVEFVDNPGHKRSKLLRLTARGEAKQREMTERIQDAADALARDLPLKDLKSAAGILARLSDRLDGA
ncbi:MAG: MarR family transcriptional regulator [Alphaproteobacteria bacterium]|nr:MarR family transcriptional regulator [Alphaproteobacteria bacterium]